MRLKRFIASAILGLSVLTISAGVTGVTPVTVGAAVRKPVIDLKAKTFTVGLGSQLDVYKNVIKSVKKGTYPIRSVRVASVRASNGKKIDIKNSPILTTGNVPPKVLVFPSKAGAYKIKVVATDDKGNKTTSTVDFKVRPKKLSSYVKGMKTLTVTKGSSVRYLKGVTYDRSKIKTIKVNSSSVDTDKRGTYKVYYNIIGIAGDKLRIAKKVNVIAAPPTSTTTPSNPTTPTPSANPATHVKGVKDIVMVAKSKNVNLMQGITWDSTIKSVKVSSLNNIYDPTNFDLPWDDNNVLGIQNWASYFYAPMHLEYTVVPVSGSSVKMSRTVYIVDLPTAKDLANNGVTVYSSNNVPVQPDPNVRCTCTLKVTATKITVPKHPLEVCWNCGEEMLGTDVDWYDEHGYNSWLASKGQGPEGAVPGCGSTLTTSVEAFTINR